MAVSRCALRIGQQSIAATAGVVRGEPVRRATAIAVDFLLDDRGVFHGEQAVCRVSVDCRQGQRRTVSQVVSLLRRAKIASEHVLLCDDRGTLFRSVYYPLQAGIDFEHTSDSRSL